MSTDPRPIVCGPAMSAPNNYFPGTSGSYDEGNYKPAGQGCRFLISTGRICDDQDTVTVDSVHGRRCAQHPTGFSRAYARRLARLRDDTALGGYLRTWIALAMADTEPQPEPEEAAA